MIPAARLVHALPGRKRIRVAEKRGDEKYFASLENGLADCPGILAVNANFLTGSVLVRHAADDLQVWRYAAERGLFHITNDESGAPAAAQPAVSDRKAVTRNRNSQKRNFQKISSGDFNWRSLIFLGLAGLGIAQAIEGNIAVPAVTAFWYALNAFPRANDVNNLERRFVEAEPPGGLSNAEM
ncbi:HMA2 domain-containing protein [Nitrosovibrio sp. Nv6]|uniref:HMA2 domain-containing protein n=1 Tax=Nitrosovibrio sp. Nv6 TaxID=1855340 RepID=UPI0008AEDC02|nr:hypothetical protein [Nitrosovibrio sp. Nv6]SEP39477.1 hypothetical protein SAMN05216316_2794 [Nitrosovibrio sp. Nv6]